MTTARYRHAYDQAIEIEPTSKYAHYNRGVLLSDHLGRLEESQAAYYLAIQHGPNFAPAYHSRGSVPPTTASLLPARPCAP